MMKLSTRNATFWGNDDKVCGVNWTHEHVCTVKRHGERVIDVKQIHQITMNDKSNHLLWKVHKFIQMIYPWNNNAFENVSSLAAQVKTMHGSVAVDIRVSEALALPDGACGRGQRRAKGPDVLFMLLHSGNADFERGNVGQERANRGRGLFLLSPLRSVEEWHKLNLDYSTGKTKHTPWGKKEQDRREHGG